MAIHRTKKPPTLFEDTEQASLLDPTWKQEWQGMPEFVQENATSWHSMVIHFRNSEDVRKFGELIGQPLGYRPKAAWYPAAEIGRVADKRYVDEDPSDES